MFSYHLHKIFWNVFCLLISVYFCIKAEGVPVIFNDDNGFYCDKLWVYEICWSFHSLYVDFTQYNIFSGVICKSLTSLGNLRISLATGHCVQQNAQQQNCCHLGSIMLSCIPAGAFVSSDVPETWVLAWTLRMFQICMCQNLTASLNLSFEHDKPLLATCVPVSPHSDTGPNDGWKNVYPQTLTMELVVKISKLFKNR